jgi:hypothetical protein
MGRAGQLTTDGEAEDKVNQIVTASEREAAEAAQHNGQTIRGQILEENGRSGKQYLSNVLFHQPLSLIYLQNGLA